MIRNRINQFRNWCYVLGVVGLLNSCSGKNNPNQPTDTYEQGTIHISVDESFKPVIDSQIQIYEASYPQTKIIAHYKPEADCFRDLAVDSIRLIITTRGYTKDEQAFLEDSMKVFPSKSIVAYDAVAVIVHPQSADSMFTMTEIKDILTGKSTMNLTPVFDGVKATSTVRFVMDSVLRGMPLSPKVVAAETSQGVIDYVARTPRAIGFLGVSWVGNKEDTTQLSFLQKVKLAHLESTDRPGGYVQPVQANIYYRRYPMVRDLAYILKERHKGLGYGFANFLTTNRGQLIFKRAYLMPAWMPHTMRDANLSE
ncbi:MAG TPA: substrate-binding domain-containing protein [Flavisolibacter sp.]|nr:substrate-binding domain-containing protein [Flavisolibacter sp.]